MPGMETAIIGAAVSSAVSAGANKLFGGKKQSAGSTFGGINMPGVLSGSMGPGGVVQFSSGLGAYTGDMDTNAREQVNALDELRGQIIPGFGKLSSATGAVYDQRRADLRDAQRAATGDLRANIARRKILGSSFADDSLSRLDAEYQKQQNALAAEQGQLQAQNALQELDASLKTLTQRGEIRRQLVLDKVELMGMQANQALQFAQLASGAMQASTELNANLLKQSATAKGAQFGGLANAAGDYASSNIGSWLNTAAGGSGGGGNTSAASNAFSLAVPGLS